MLQSIDPETLSTKEGSKEVGMNRLGIKNRIDIVGGLEMAGDRNRRDLGKDGRREYWEGQLESGSISG